MRTWDKILSEWVKEESDANREQYDRQRNLVTSIIMKTAEHNDLLAKAHNSRGLFQVFQKRSKATRKEPVQLMATLPKTFSQTLEKLVHNTDFVLRTARLTHQKIHQTAFIYIPKCF